MTDYVSVATVFYLATCQDCQPVLPQPFFDEVGRDEWTRKHREGTGHEVDLSVEVRLSKPAKVER